MYDQPREPSEAVYAVHHYYDGPRSGVADLEGRPHVFVVVFDQVTDDWSDLILLSPLDDTALRLFREESAIWERWLSAHQTGQTTVETHPALPEDRSRYAEIHEALRQMVAIDPETARWARGTFRSRLPPDMRDAMARRSLVDALTVTWSIPHPWEADRADLHFIAELQPKLPYSLWRRIP